MLCSLFNKDNYSIIHECLEGGMSMMIYGTKSKGILVVVAVVNFVIARDGVYMNWIGTNSGKFWKSYWIHGDKALFQKKGCMTILLEILFKLVVLLKEKNKISDKKYGFK